MLDTTAGSVSPPGGVINTETYPRFRPGAVRLCHDHAAIDALMHSSQCVKVLVLVV